MHGIETIQKLNELAEQNANAGETLKAAQEANKGKIFPSTQAQDEALAKLRTA